MNVDAESICSVLIKLACVHVAVGMMEVSLPFGHSITPITLVLGTIKPYLRTLSMFDVNLLMLILVDHFFHLPSIRRAFSNLKVCFMNDLLFIDFLNFVAESRLVDSAVLVLSDALPVATLFLIIDFVVTWLTFGWLATALIAHAKIRMEIFKSNYKAF